MSRAVDLAALRAKYRDLEAEAQSTGLGIGKRAPSAFHVQLIDLLDWLIGKGLERDGTVKVNPAMRGMLHALRRLKPDFLEELAQIPEDELRRLVHDLLREIVARVPAAFAPAPDAGESPHALRPDQPAPAGAGPLGGGDGDRQVGAG